ncbi:MAG: rhomboid family intramembrane serine protease, partial [Jatrophihabitantaceae bacterium]
PDGRPRTRAQQRRHELAHTSLRHAMRPASPSGAIVVMTLVLIVLWLVLGVDAALDHRWLRLGIKPRELGGLDGIVLTPVLHASAGQLAANSLPLAVFGWIMLVSGLRTFAVVTVPVWLVSGLVGWLAGPSHAVILGASGVIFGWLGYVLARAWFSRKVAWIATAVAVLAVFSGMLSGLLPRLHSNTFWGSQLAGFLAGVLVGAVLHRKRKGRPAGQTALPGNL